MNKEKRNLSYDLKELTWAQFCRYCNKVIRTYTYKEILLDLVPIDQENKYCCKRHEFLDKLRGPK